MRRTPRKRKGDAPGTVTRRCTEGCAKVGVYPRNCNPGMHRVGNKGGYPGDNRPRDAQKAVQRGDPTDMQRRCTGDCHLGVPTGCAKRGRRPEHAKGVPGGALGACARPVLPALDRTAALMVEMGSGTISLTPAPLLPCTPFSCTSFPCIPPLAPPSSAPPPLQPSISLPPVPHLLPLLSAIPLEMAWGFF